MITETERQLIQCLNWYVQNDDVNLGDPENGYYIHGYNEAVKLLNQFGFDYELGEEQIEDGN